MRGRLRMTGFVGPTCGCAATRSWNFATGSRLAQPAHANGASIAMNAATQDARTFLRKITAAGRATQRSVALLLRSSLPRTLAVAAGVAESSGGSVADPAPSLGRDA